MISTKLHHLNKAIQKAFITEVDTNLHTFSPQTQRKKVAFEFRTWIAHYLSGFASCFHMRITFVSP